MEDAQGTDLELEMRRRNAGAPQTPQDYATALSAEAVERGDHRRFVGGKWNRLGKLQLEFMQQQGLEPSSKLLDVGCGALRAGRKFVGYLDAGNYYGVDINEVLLKAGYEVELKEWQRKKLPRDHLRATDRFEVDFGVRFDFAIAQSLFTHLTLNHIRLCLYRVAKVMAPGGRFYTTFFAAPRDDYPIDGIMGTRRGRYQEQNPFWYYPGDLEWAGSFSPWAYRYIGEWGHPIKGHHIAEFTRR